MPGAVLCRRTGGHRLQVRRVHTPSQRRLASDCTLRCAPAFVGTQRKGWSNFTRAPHLYGAKRARTAEPAGGGGDRGDEPPPRSASAPPAARSASSSPKTARPTAFSPSWCEGTAPSPRSRCAVSCGFVLCLLSARPRRRAAAPPRESATRPSRRSSQRLSLPSTRATSRRVAPPAQLPRLV